ncbi:signal peptide peptidase-like 2B [Pocillopora damicornis]|uniref:signal peptide peptidase-like 2B n=1 Tax=Pocillopora damicornis TaxID=46731 RepID=UPI000F54D4C3|nr:signal peptide peptidase-like 2B [Pocillopora damicornis]
MAAFSGGFVLLLMFCTFTNQGAGQNVGQLGVLHIEGNEDSQDFCIAFNEEWVSLPTHLDSTPKYPLVEAKPSTLCKEPQNHSEIKDAAVAIQRGNCTLFLKALYSQNAGAKEVVIVSNDSLFTPVANSSEEYAQVTIPMAVISHDDWIKYKDKDFGGDVKVQMYAPPTDLVSNIDGNLAILWLLAVGTVAIGAYWAGITNKKIMGSMLRGNTNTSGDDSQANREHGSAGEDSFEVTPLSVVVFVLLVCGTLLLLYFFYKYLVYVVIVGFALASCYGLYECLHPLVLWLPLGDCTVPANQIPLLKKELQIRTVLLIPFCLAIAIWWGIERNKSYAWILQDILGISFCISLMRVIRLPSLKVCTLLLVLLLIYDAFFVYITPLFSAGKSIMVEVATGGDSKESLPMVIKVPRLRMSVLSVCLRPYSILGFGDILVPALYISFCHTFDIMMNTPCRIYYVATTVAYAVGLLITFVMLFVMEQGQPALVYLVPCILITGVVIGWRRGDLKKLWSGQMVSEDVGQNDDSEDEEFNQESLTKRLIDNEN